MIQIIQKRISISTMGTECVVFFSSFSVWRGYKLYCIPIFNTENNLYCIFKISASGLFIKHPLISASIKHVPIYKRVFRSVSYATHFESRSRDKAGAWWLEGSMWAPLIFFFSSSIFEFNRIIEHLLDSIFVLRITSYEMEWFLIFSPCFSITLFIDFISFTASTSRI